MHKTQHPFGFAFSVCSVYSVVITLPFNMNKPLTYGLLLSILMVIAPHAEHLPIWVSSLCAGLLLWRAWLAYTGKPLPKRWLLMLVTFAGTGGIAFEFHTLFGREAGVTLLM